MFFRRIFITALLPGPNPMMRRGSDKVGRDKKKIAIDKTIDIMSSHVVEHETPYLHMGCAIILQPELEEYVSFSWSTESTGVLTSSWADTVLSPPAMFTLFKSMIGFVISGLQEIQGCF